MAKGVVLTNEGVNPIPGGSFGLWRTGNDLMITTPGGSQVNISASSSGTGLFVPVKNTTGSTISKGAVVSVDGAGELILTDVSISTRATKVLGVASENILSGNSGLICVNGKIDNLTTSLGFGDRAFLSSTAGALTATVPSIGVDGFVSGDYVISVGLIIQDPSTPGQKNLVVNMDIVGTLV